MPIFESGSLLWAVDPTLLRPFKIISKWCQADATSVCICTGALYSRWSKDASCRKNIGKMKKVKIDWPTYSCQRIAGLLISLG